MRSCPGDPPNCEAKPTPDEEELTGQLSKYQLARRYVMGVKTGKPDTNQGMVVHDFHLACATAGTAPVRNSWERVVPSPFDDYTPGTSDADGRVLLATMPYVWLQRRYAGPALLARDPLHCAQGVPALPPASAVRLMTAGSTCYVAA